MWNTYSCQALFTLLPDCYYACIRKKLQEGFQVSQTCFHLHTVRGAIAKQPFIRIPGMPGHSIPQDHVIRVKAQLNQCSPHDGCRWLAHAIRIHIQPACSLGPKDRKSTRLNSSHVATSYAVF